MTEAIIPIISINSIIRNGRFEDVRRALDEGASLISEDDHYNNPLQIALTERHDTEIAALLVERGLSTETGESGQGPLHICCEAGATRVAKMLLDRGADPNARNYTSETPLMLSAGRGSGKTAALLIKRGADVNARSANNFSALHKAALDGDTMLVGLLLEAGAEVHVVSVKQAGGGSWHFVYGTPLHWAAAYENVKNKAIVQRLLKAGADPTVVNELGQMPIHYAGSIHSATSGLSALLAHHDDVDIRDEKGWTALHHAADRRTSNIAALLINAGADVEAQIPSTQKRPLHIAAGTSSPSVLKLLIEANADVDAPVKDGKVPLHFAAEKKRKPNIEALLLAKANASAADKHGVTPLHIASSRGRLEIVKLLLNAGANPHAKIKADRKIGPKGATPKSLAAPSVSHLFKDK